jgi:hypothetical protein
MHNRFLARAISDSQQASALVLVFHAVVLCVHSNRIVAGWGLLQVPVMVSVSIFPFAEATRRALVVTLPAFFSVASTVLSFTRFSETMSTFGLPVTDSLCHRIGLCIRMTFCCHRL